MIKYFYKSAKDKQMKTLESFKGGSWVLSEKPSEKELSFLTGKFNLDEGLLRDSIDEYEVPRLEIEDKVIYIFMRYAYQEGNTISTTPVLIAIGDNFLLTVGKIVSPLLENIEKSRNGFTTSQRISILLKILNAVNYTFNTYLRDINKRVRLSSIRLEKIQNNDIVRFVTYENVLNDFLSALIPASSIFNLLLSGKHLRLDEANQDLIEDLKLSNNEIIEVCRSTLRSMVNIREAYSTIVTNNLNSIIKLLTSLTVILAIPTMISSFFGMNVPLGFIQTPFTFLAIVLCSIIIVSFFIYIFIKKDWI